MRSPRLREERRSGRSRRCRGRRAPRRASRASRASPRRGSGRACSTYGPRISLSAVAEDARRAVVVVDDVALAVGRHDDVGRARDQALELLLREAHGRECSASTCAVPNAALRQALLREPALRVDRRHAARAGRRDRLAVDRIHRVAAGEHALARRARTCRAARRCSRRRRARSGRGRARVFGWCPIATNSASTGSSRRAPVCRSRTRTPVTKSSPSTSSTSAFQSELDLRGSRARAPA